VLTREIRALAAVVVLGAIMTMLDATIVNVGGGREMFSGNLDVLLGYVGLVAATGARPARLVAVTHDTG
jgi:hypothetical protein